MEDQEEIDKLLIQQENDADYPQGEIDEVIREYDAENPVNAVCIVCHRDERAESLIILCDEHKNTCSAHRNCIELHANRNECDVLVCRKCSCYFIAKPTIVKEEHTLSRMTMLRLIHLFSTWKTSNHGINGMDEIRHERRLAGASLVMFFLVVTFCVIVMFGMALTNGMDWRAEIAFFTIVGPLLIFALIAAPEKASYFLKMSSNARDASNMIDVFLIARVCVIVIYLASYMLMMSLTTNETSYAWNLTVSASFILVSVYLLAISHMKMRRTLRTVQYTFTRVSTVVE